MANCYCWLKQKPLLPFGVIFAGVVTCKKKENPTDTGYRNAKSICMTAENNRYESVYGLNLTVLIKHLF